MTPERPPRRITDLNAARALFAPLAREQAEVAAFAYLDPEWRLLGLRHTHGRGDMIEVLTAGGESCGCLHLENLGTETAIGLDGSVIAPYPSGFTDQCRYDLYPALLQ